MYWLVKTEPEVYSFTKLLKDKRMHWDGVRNHQAKNNLKAMKKGDLVLVYHSQDPRSVVGVAEVVKEFYPDTFIKPDDPKGEWVMVDIAPVKAMTKEVTLDEIKKEKSLSQIALVKQSRLSVMPLDKDAFLKILKMGETKL